MTEFDESIFLTQDKFFKTVEEFILEFNIGYIEATIKACEHYLIDYEDVYKMNLISPNLKSRIRVEGVDDGSLKKESQLPI